jgi:hypothetical protein
MATYLVESGHAVIGWNRILGRWIVALGASPTVWTGPASGARFLDAPAARTLSQSESRQVILFVGGNESGFEYTKPIFQAIGCAAHHLGSIGCGLVFKVAVNDLLAVQVARVNGCFQAATIMQAMTEMVKVFGCRQASENRPSTNPRVAVTVYGDFVFCLVDVVKPTFQELRRRRHSPPSHRQLPAIGPVTDDWRRVVGEDASKYRQVAGAVVHRLHQIADGLLAPGHRIKVAHGILLRPPEHSRP